MIQDTSCGFVAKNSVGLHCRRLCLEHNLVHHRDRGNKYVVRGPSVLSAFPMLSTYSLKSQFVLGCVYGEGEGERGGMGRQTKRDCVLGILVNILGCLHATVKSTLSLAILSASGPCTVTHT